MKILNKLFIIFCFEILFFAFNLSLANAQNFDIGIYPPILQIQANPPTTVKAVLTIQNFDDQDQKLSISFLPFTQNKDLNGGISYITRTDPNFDTSILDRVRILDNNAPVDSISLSPGEKKDLTLLIDLPKDQHRGDFYFSTIFTSQDTADQKMNSSLANGAIASNILLSVGPIGKTQGSIEKFSSPIFVTKGPVPFNVEIKNSSDHFIAPTGNIVIKNLFGQTIGKVDLLPVNILAGSKRFIPDLLQSPLSKDKDYEKITSLVEKSQNPIAVWPENFLFGIYTATLNIKLSEGSQEVSKSINFFALPLDSILSIILIIGIVFYIVKRVRNNLKKRN